MRVNVAIITKVTCTYSFAMRRTLAFGPVSSTLLAPGVVVTFCGFVGWVEHVLKVLTTVGTIGHLHGFGRGKLLLNGVGLKSWAMAHGAIVNL